MERWLARSGVTRKSEFGTATPLIPCSSSSAFDGSAKRSSQITSLATNRSACAASTLPARVASCVFASSTNAAARPFSPL